MTDLIRRKIPYEIRHAVTIDSGSVTLVRERANDDHLYCQLYSKGLPSPSEGLARKFRHYRI